MNQKELAHIWAHRIKESGKSSSMFFEKDTIYSYGHHFPIARHYDENTIFFTTRRYSTTTAKHLSYVDRAIPNEKTVFHVYNPEENDKSVNMDHYVERAKNEAKRLAGARLNKSTNHYESIYNEAAAYAKKFKIKNRVPKLDKKSIEAATIANKKAIECKKALTLRRIAEQAADLEKWKNGENIQRRFDTVALRIEDQEIVTTLGARVPVNSARLLYLMIKSGRPVAGEKVGYYTVNHVNEKEIKIGCHIIPMAEIDRIGKILTA